jgi:regulator of protease activity HflC (stomatin/prohibitin superfamily)
MNEPTNEELLNQELDETLSELYEWDSELDENKEAITNRLKSWAVKFAKINQKDAADFDAVADAIYKRQKEQCEQIEKEYEAQREARSQEQKERDRLHNDLLRGLLTNKPIDIAGMMGKIIFTKFDKESDE